MTYLHTRAHSLLTILLVLVALFIPVFGLQAEGPSNNSGEQIAFLHLKVDANGISLLDHILADGALKRPKTATGSFGLGVQVVDQTGNALFEQVLENPLVKRYEYEDPDNPGKIISKVVYLDEAEFWVRIPLTSASDKVQFQQEDRRPGGELLRPDSRLTGTINLDLVRGGN